MQIRKWIVLGCALAVLWPAAAHAGAAEDKAIANQIGAEIRESGQLSNYRVGVKFQDGVAWLLGSVTDSDQAAAAVKLAKQVDGVSRVINRLEVKPAEASNANAMHFEPTESKPATELQSMEEVAEPRLESLAHEPSLQQTAPARTASRGGMPRPVAWSGRSRPIQQTNYGHGGGGPRPAGYHPGGGGGATGVGYDSPNLPGYAWPSYAAPQNYSALTYPKQYSPTAWPYIGPFYPYPQVPLGWRKVALEWDDGWWFLDFSHNPSH